MRQKLNIDAKGIVTFDLGVLLDGIDPEVRQALAESLCWDEVLVEAAKRLAGESETWSGYGESDTGDQRDRLAFLDAVKVRADDELRVEVAQLKRKLAAAKDDAESGWARLGYGGPSNGRSWSDAEFDRHRRASEWRDADRKARAAKVTP